MPTLVKIIKTQIILAVRVTANKAFEKIYSIEYTITPENYQRIWKQIFHSIHRYMEKVSLN